MIYFVQPVGGGPVKIGYSEDVHARCRQLEAWYGHPLVVLAALPGNRHEEAGIHSRFSHLRMGRTEQFRPAMDLLAFIGRPLLVGPNPDAVEVMPAPMGRTIGVRATGEWADWAERLAKHCRTDLAKLIDAALVGHAKATGFTEPPPERIP